MNDNEISVRLKTRQHKPVRNMKILCILRATHDTLSGYTNAEGTCTIRINGKNHMAKVKSNKTDDVEVIVIYRNKKLRQYAVNTFSSLSADIECVIDDDARNEIVLRKTTYKVDKSELVYLFQQYNKEVTSPATHLFGSFSFYKE